MISAICVTYGRVKFLESAIGDFLAQDYQGRRAMLVLNTLPKQTLHGEFPNVEIVNLQTRPKSLGQARNLAIGLAGAERFVVVDDDDAYLPHFLSTFAKHWTYGLEWLWLDKRLCAMGDKITSISIGCHGGCFGFTQKAWREVGGYPEDMSVGEDRVLVGKIMKNFPGKKVELGDSLPPFIACWGNGAFHVSGEGDDKVGMPGAYQRAEAALSRRIASGQEKTGLIELRPRHDATWLDRANAFMAAESKKNSMNDVCVVELGRYGDIINILPILQHINNEYGKPTLMVSREFADLLDGVSYVTPHVVSLRNDELAQAVAIARKQYKHVLCAQIWGGPAYLQERLCPSYNMESWRMCGFLNRFDDDRWRPLFDKRDEEREQTIVMKLKDERPMVMVNLNSVSSPFPYGASLSAEIYRRFGKLFNIVDISKLKLHRIYDLLGLMNFADCLVTVDSAPLHLAAASPVPVVALVNDHPWLGTSPRCWNCYVFSYANFSHGNVLNKIGEMVRDAHTHFPRKQASIQLSSPPSRNIFHCYERHADSEPRDKSRKADMQKSWKALYKAGVIPVCLDENFYPRDARSIGETRPLPFLRDVLAVGMEKAEPDDIIFFTNDDDFLHPELPELLRFHVSVYECCSAQRCEFKRTPMPKASRPPGEFTRNSMSHMGRDLFAFTKKWLVSHWNEIPDFILGCSDWDLCLATMVRNHFGIKTTRQNLETVMFPAELPLGYVSHVWHAPHWDRPEYTNTAPGQLHNRMAFKCWAKEHAPHLTFDKFGCI